MPKSRSSRSEKDRGEEKDRWRSGRSERGDSGERKWTGRDRSRSEERSSKSGEKKGRDRIKRRSTDGEVVSSSATSGYYRSDRAGDDGLPDVQSGAGGFSQFPGHYDAAMPSGPPSGPGVGSYGSAPLSNHVPDMFPGQFPAESSAPYRPPLSLNEGGPGLASDYYNDDGQSVQHQPGVRPAEPTLIIGAEPHLMAASAVAAPPIEPSATGGTGAAASFYSAQSFQSPSTSPKPARPSKPSKTSKPSKPLRPNDPLSAVSPHDTSGFNFAGAGLGAAAAGAAADYFMNEHDSSHHQSTYASGNGLSNSMPQQGSYSTDFKPPRPDVSPRHSPSLLGNAAGAAGAAGLAAAAYNHHQQHHNHDDYYDGGYNSSDMMQHRRRRGPMSRFVDFFRDPEGVAKYEEYSEYIGVCRYCFEPGSTPRDAPRKHRPGRRRSFEKKNGSSTRVDKEYRYSISDENKRRDKSWVASAATGLGFAAAGKALFGNNRDFDDTYSVHSGRPGASSSSVNLVRRYSSDDERRFTKRGTIGLTESDLKKVRIESLEQDSKIGRSERERKTRSRDSKSGVTEGLVGATVVAAALGSEVVKRSSSPKETRFRRKSRSSSPSDRAYGKRRLRRSSPSRKESPGFFAGLFGSPTPEDRKSRRNKKSGGFFSMSNGSSSSVSSRVVGTESDRARRKRSSKKIESTEEAKAAVIDLGIAASALAAADRGSSGSRRSGRVVAVKESKGKEKEKYRRHGDHDSHRRHEHADSAEDMWEDASDEETHVDYGLAYDSDGSHGSLSGTQKWDWRWKRSSSPKRSSSGTGIATAAAAGLAGVAVGSALEHRERDHRERRDDRRYYEPGSKRPERPGPVPLQQPQPIAPVSSTVYRVEDSYDSHGRERYDDGKYKYDSGSKLNGYGQPTYHESAYRDNEARIVTVSPKPPKSKSSEEPSMVRFNFTEEQERRHLEKDGDDLEKMGRRGSESRGSEKKRRRRRESSDDYESRSTREENRSSKDRSWAEPAVAGVAAAAIGAVVANEVSKSEDKKQRRREERNEERDDRAEYESRRREKKPSGWDSVVGAAVGAEETKRSRRSSKGSRKDEDPYDDLSDEARDHLIEERERIIARRAANLVKRAPSPAHEDYASYFAPEEILSRPAEGKEKAHPGMDENSYGAPNIVTVEPKDSKGRTNELVFAGLEKFDDPPVNLTQLNFPWQVPPLRLVSPTPPPPIITQFDDDQGSSKRAKSRDVTEETPEREKTREVEEEIPKRGKRREDREEITERDKSREAEEDTSKRERRREDQAETPKRGKNRETEEETPKRGEGREIEDEILNGEMNREVEGEIPKRGKRREMEDAWSKREKPRDINEQEFTSSNKGKVSFGVNKTHEYEPMTPEESREELTRDSDLPKTIRSVKNETPNVESPVEEIPREHVPGAFEDDIDFAATIAAGLEEEGFDPNIVIQDPHYRRRNSPPGSNGDSFYQQPSYQTVSDIAIGSRNSEPPGMQHGWVEDDELPPTPKDEARAAVVETEDGKKAVEKEKSKKKKSKSSLSNSTSVDDYEESEKSQAASLGADDGDAELDIIEAASRAGSADEAFETAVKSTPQEPERSAFTNGDRDRRSNGTREFNDYKDDVYESPTDDAASTVSAPTAVGEDKESRKSKKKKRRSVRDDDNDSVVSSPAKIDETRKRSGSTSSKKSGGIFGIFSRAVDDAADNRRTREDFGVSDDPGSEDKKGKSRSRSERSREAEDDQDSSRKSKKKEKRRSRQSTDGDDDDTGRRSRDLPSKGQDLDTSELALQDGSPGSSRTRQIEDDNEQPSFLGERPKPTKPPDLAGERAEEHRGREPNIMSTPDRGAAFHTRSGSSQPSFAGGVGSELTFTTPERPRRLSITSSGSAFTTSTPSPTAVPLSFMRRPSAIATATLGRSSSSTPLESPSTPRSRKGRPQSTEFNPKEFRPLFLVERHSAKEAAAAAEDETYPSLPSSHSNSRSSSIHGDSETEQPPAERGYAAAPTEKSETTPKSKFKGAALDLGSAKELKADDLLDSEQVTPTAASFAEDRRMKLERDALEQAMHEHVSQEYEWNQRNSGEYSRRSGEGSKRSSGESQSSKGHERDDASIAMALGAAALVGGGAAVALGREHEHDHESHEERGVSEDAAMVDQQSMSTNKEPHRMDVEESASELLPASRFEYPVEESRTGDSSDAFVEDSTDIAAIPERRLSKGMSTDEVAAAMATIATVDVPTNENEQTLASGQSVDSVEISSDKRDVAGAPSEGIEDVEHYSLDKDGVRFAENAETSEISRDIDAKDAASRRGEESSISDSPVELDQRERDVPVDSVQDDIDSVWAVAEPVPEGILKRRGSKKNKNKEKRRSVTFDLPDELPDLSAVEVQPSERTEEAVASDEEPVMYAEPEEIAPADSEEAKPFEDSGAIHEAGDERTRADVEAESATAGRQMDHDQMESTVETPREDDPLGEEGTADPFEVNNAVDADAEDDGSQMQSGSKKKKKKDKKRGAKKEDDESWFTPASENQEEVEAESAKDPPVTQPEQEPSEPDWAVSSDKKTKRKKDKKKRNTSSWEDQDTSEPPVAEESEQGTEFSEAQLDTPEAVEASTVQEVSEPASVEPDFAEVEWEKPTGKAKKGGKKKKKKQQEQAEEDWPAEPLNDEPFVAPEDVTLEQSREVDGPEPISNDLSVDTSATAPDAGLVDELAIPGWSNMNKKQRKKAKAAAVAAAAAAVFAEPAIHSEVEHNASEKAADVEEDGTALREFGRTEDADESSKRSSSMLETDMGDQYASENSQKLSKLDDQEAIIPTAREAPEETDDNLFEKTPENFRMDVDNQESHKTAEASTDPKTIEKDSIEEMHAPEPVISEVALSTADETAGQEDPSATELPDTRDVDEVMEQSPPEHEIIEDADSKPWGESYQAHPTAADHASEESRVPIDEHSQATELIGDDDLPATIDDQPKSNLLSFEEDTMALDNDNAAGSGQEKRSISDEPERQSADPEPEFEVPLTKAQLKKLKKKQKKSRWENEEDEAPLNEPEQESMPVEPQSIERSVEVEEQPEDISEQTLARQEPEEVAADTPEATTFDTKKSKKDKKRDKKKKQTAAFDMGSDAEDSKAMAVEPATTAEVNEDAPEQFPGEEVAAEPAPEPEADPDLEYALPKRKGSKKKKKGSKFVPWDDEEPAKPADVEEPAKPADVEEPAKLADVEEPAKLADVEEPAKPADVEEPAKPADIEEPAKPADVEESLQDKDESVAVGTGTKEEEGVESERTNVLPSDQYHAAQDREVRMQESEIEPTTEAQTVAPSDSFEEHPVEEVEEQDSTDVTLPAGEELVTEGVATTEAVRNDDAPPEQMEEEQSATIIQQQAEPDLEFYQPKRKGSKKNKKKNFVAWDEEGESRATPEAQTNQDESSTTLDLGGEPQLSTPAEIDVSPAPVQEISAETQDKELETSTTQENLPAEPLQQMEEEPAFEVAAPKRNGSKKKKKSKKFTSWDEEPETQQAADTNQTTLTDAATESARSLDEQTVDKSLGSSTDEAAADTFQQFDDTTNIDQPRSIREESVPESTEVQMSEDHTSTVQRDVSADDFRDHTEVPEQADTERPVAADEPSATAMSVDAPSVDAAAPVEIAEPADASEPVDMAVKENEPDNWSWTAPSSSNKKKNKKQRKQSRALAMAETFDNKDEGLAKNEGNEAPQQGAEADVGRISEDKPTEDHARGVTPTGDETGDLVLASSEAPHEADVTDTHTLNDQSSTREIVEPGQSSELTEPSDSTRPATEASTEQDQVSSQPIEIDPSAELESAPMTKADRKKAKKDKKRKSKQWGLDDDSVEQSPVMADDPAVSTQKEAPLSEEQSPEQLLAEEPSEEHAQAHGSSREVESNQPREGDLSINEPPEELKAQDEPEPEPEAAFPIRKLSKKEKKRQERLAAMNDTPPEIDSSAAESQVFNEHAFVEEPLPVEEDTEQWPVTNSKKKKRKSKQERTESEFDNEVLTSVNPQEELSGQAIYPDDADMRDTPANDLATGEPMVEEAASSRSLHSNAPTDEFRDDSITMEPQQQDVDDEFSTPSKGVKSKKKRKSKQSRFTDWDDEAPRSEPEESRPTREPGLSTPNVEETMASELPMRSDSKDIEISYRPTQVVSETGAYEAEQAKTLADSEAMETALVDESMNAEVTEPTVERYGDREAMPIDKARTEDDLADESWGFSSSKQKKKKKSKNKANQMQSEDFTSQPTTSASVPEELGRLDASDDAAMMTSERNTHFEATSAEMERSLATESARTIEDEETEQIHQTYDVDNPVHESNDDPSEINKEQEFEPGFDTATVEEEAAWVEAERRALVGLPTTDETPNIESKREEIYSANAPQEEQFEERPSRKKKSKRKSKSQQEEFEAEPKEEVFPAKEQAQSPITEPWEHGDERFAKLADEEHAPSITVGSHDDFDEPREFGTEEPASAKYHKGARRGSDNDEIDIASGVVAAATAATAAETLQRSASDKKSKKNKKKKKTTQWQDFEDESGEPSGAPKTYSPPEYLAEPEYHEVDPGMLRDSAVYMDTPDSPPMQRSVRDIRDSGYQGSPMMSKYGEFEDGNGRKEQEIGEVVPTSPRSPSDIHRRSRSRSRSRSPTTSEVERSLHHSHEADLTSDIGSLREAAGSPAPGEGLGSDGEMDLPKQRARDVSPVEPTSRDRGSAALFSSSPSTRETPRHDYRNVRNIAQTFTPDQETSEARARSVDDEMGHESLSDATGLKSPPKTPTAFEGTPLATITESSPEDVHPHKHTRDVSDVGEPEHGVKASRKSTLSPQPHGHYPHRAHSPLNPENPRRLGHISTEDLISKQSWPELDEQEAVQLDRAKSRGSTRSNALSSPSPDLSRPRRPPSLPLDSTAHNRRSVSGESVRSGDSISAYIRPSPEPQHPGHHSLRRQSNRSLSSDLREASRVSQSSDTSTKKERYEADAKTEGARGKEEENIVASSSTYDPTKDKGKSRITKMADVYEAYGGAQGSPRSPTRPPSMRRRQSLQILDLETRLDQVLSENRLLQDAKSRAERGLDDAHSDHDQKNNALTDAVRTRDIYLQQKDEELEHMRNTLEVLQHQVSELTTVNAGLTAAHAARSLDDGFEEKYRQLEEEHRYALQEREDNQHELESLRNKHTSLSGGMEGIIRQEVSAAVASKDAEIQAVREELEAAQEQVRTLQQQILQARNAGGDDESVVERDEDYFESRCQKLCQHIQTWVLRFSKYSDLKICRSVKEINDDAIRDRFEDVMLDGSDVDTYLRHRVRRRDVFMAVIMGMVQQYIFMRYLFGMDREQRNKLKALEKHLSEVGSDAAVNRWRATTLSLLTRRPAFAQQREADIAELVEDLYATLAKVLNPPSDKRQAAREGLVKVMGIAADLSIEMRLQRARYVMLPPLAPEYDADGDLARTIPFNASMMNERSGRFTSNEQLQADGAAVRLMLFPLVVQRDGDADADDGEDIIVCPAQVLVASDEDDAEEDPRQGKSSSGKKAVRVVSAASLGTTGTGVAEGGMF